MAQRQSDVLVLGGGVIGLACALALLKQGRSVTVLEQNTAGSGASHGNCGTITPSLLPLPAPGVVRQALKWMMAADSPLLIRPTLNPSRLSWLLHFAAHSHETAFRKALQVKLPLLLRSRELLELLVTEERLDCEFSAGGHLQVYREAAAFDRALERASWAAEFGLVTEALDAARLRALEPALNDSVIGGLHNPGDAQLRPERLVSELARAVRQRGGVIHEHTAVTGFCRDQARISSVATSLGDYRGRDIVFALGAWSPLLSRQLQLHLPIQPGKGYSITYSSPARPPGIPLVLKERGVCVTAWGSGYRLGSTMEFAGHDATLNRVRLDALKRGAREYLHDPLGEEMQEEWCGWRPMTYDDLPIIGRSPTLDNLWLATGHGMLGVTLCAVTGQLISELLTERATSLDVQPFSPRRFHS